MTKHYRNILVINLMHIGDLMLVTPALRTLRTNYPKSRITLVADEKLRDLVECNECLDTCLFLDKKGRDDSLIALYRFIKKIRKNHYDLVINLQRNERASAIAAFSGGAHIVGYAKPFFSLFFEKVLRNRAMPGTPPALTLHQVEAHLRVLETAVGIDARDDRGIEMIIPAEEEHEGNTLYHKYFMEDEKIVAFNVGASWNSKRYLTRYFARCADTLLKTGYTVAFFGGPGDESIVSAVIAEMTYKDHARLRVFTGRLRLGTLAALLRRCCLMITTDSGPMHIAVAMNLPVVTMFGPSPVPTFYPYDGRSILLKTPESCHPCGRHECPRHGEDYMGCMKHILPASIMSAAEQVLAETGGAPACELAPHTGNYQCRVIEL